MVERKRKTHTSSAVKARYNKKSYARYIFTVRLDSELHRAIELYKEQHPNEMSKLIKELLEEYFAKS